MRYFLCIALLAILWTSDLSASNLVLCGTIADGSDADRNFDPGIVGGTCSFGDHGRFQGEIREEVGSDFYRLIIHGELWGAVPQALLGQGDYSLFGEGREIADFRVFLSDLNIGPPLTAGGEFVRVSTFGSSFSNNPAVAQVNVPAGEILGARRTAFNQRMGEFSGDGLAQAFGAWDSKLEVNASYFVVHANYTYQIVPEPTTLALVAVALGVLGGLTKRRLTI